MALPIRNPLLLRSNSIASLAPVTQKPQIVRWQTLLYRLGLPLNPSLISVKGASSVLAAPQGPECYRQRWAMLGRHPARSASEGSRSQSLDNKAPIGVSASRSLAPPGNLELLDMPDPILQHISTFVPSQQWAENTVFVCRKLYGLSLPVLKVGYKYVFAAPSRLPNLLVWMGKRIATTTHLAISIGCMEGCTLGEVMCHLQSSGHKLSAEMETLILTRACRCQCQIRCKWYEYEGVDCGIPTGGVTMAQVHGPSLRHMCLQIPPSTMIERGCSEDSEDPSEIIQRARHLYSFKQMSGMHSKNLPSLQTLFLQGLREPVEVRGLHFRDSNTLEVINVHDCWIRDLSIPPACKVFVSAQSSLFIVHMDGSREHPMVSRATHVRLPTDLRDCMYRINRSTELRQRHTMGIPNMFPAMRTLRLTWPDERVRCFRYCSSNDRLECFQHKYEVHDVIYMMKCLPRHWEHVNLKKLIIEGKNLGVTIPALPSLETLMVVCTGTVALHLVDASSLGCVITKMSVAGRDIHFDGQQRQELCMALKARELKLVGDWRRCISVQGCSDPVYSAKELQRQAMQGLACQCGACPSCLGIGQNMLDEDT